MRFTLSLLLSFAAFAQPPRGFFPWWEGQMVRDLHLTEDQQKQIQSTVREYRNRLVDLRAAVEKADMDIEDLLNEGADPKRAADATNRLVTARGDLTRAYTELSLRLRAVLTPQQWRELQRRRPMPPPPPPAPPAYQQMGPRPARTPDVPVPPAPPAPPNER